MSALKPIIICCLPSTGSTWLNALLCEHPDLYGGPETSLFHMLGPKLVEGRAISGWRHQEAVRDAVAEFVDVVLGPAWAMSDRRPVEKTPGHWRYLPDIHAMFPDADFVWLIRGRSRWRESMLRHHPPCDHEAVWQEHMAMMARWHETGRYRIHRVVYESLCDQPKKDLASLLASLEVSSKHVEAMLAKHPVKR